jgi:hypothetical protein
VLLRINNVPQAYSWGSATAIAELMGTTPSGGPEAELWLGDHPGSPARIVGGEREVAETADLSALLSERGEKLPFSTRPNATTKTSCTSPNWFTHSAIHLSLSPVFDPSPRHESR